MYAWRIFLNNCYRLEASCRHNFAKKIIGMKTINNLNAMKALKVFHILFGIMWIGGAMALFHLDVLSAFAFILSDDRE